MMLAAFLSGAALGLRFHEERFLGGYASFRRRTVRLGHVALAALGLINVVFSSSPWPDPSEWPAGAASASFLIGGLTMPSVCFLTAWRARLRVLFVIPVTALIVAVCFVLIGAAR
jgi:hypothetical protein